MGMKTSSSKYSQVWPDPASPAVIPGIPYTQIDGGNVATRSLEHTFKDMGSTWKTHIIRAVVTAQCLLIAFTALCGVYVMTQCHIDLHDCTKLQTEATLFIVLAAVNLVGAIATFCQVEKCLKLRHKAALVQVVLAVLPACNLAYLVYRQHTLQRAIGGAMFAADVVTLVVYLLLIVAEVAMFLIKPPATPSKQWDC